MSSITDYMDLSLVDHFNMFEHYIDGSPLAISKAQQVVSELDSPDERIISYWTMVFCRLLTVDASIKHLRGMAYSGFIGKFIDCFDATRDIAQDKQHGHNLMDHLLLTVDALSDFDPNRATIIRTYWTIAGIDPSFILIFSCLLHDIGKVIDINDHEYVGADYAAGLGDLFGQYVYNDYLGDHLFDVINNHMRPFGYQRGEEWSDTAIAKFIDDCNGIQNALLVVCLAIADKKASTRNESYLDRLYELFDRCVGLRGPQQNT